MIDILNKNSIYVNVILSTCSSANGFLEALGVLVAEQCSLINAGYLLGQKRRVPDQDRGCLFLLKSLCQILTFSWHEMMTKLIHFHSQLSHTPCLAYMAAPSASSKKTMCMQLVGLLFAIYLLLGPRQWSIGAPGTDMMVSSWTQGHTNGH